MRFAVVKSGLRSASRTFGSRFSANSISRSIIAPLAMRPTVGTPRDDFGGIALGLEAAEIASEPWATA